MVRHFVLLLLFFLKANLAIGLESVKQVKYEIYSHDAKTLLVILKFDGNQSGITNITIPFLNSINWNKLIIKDAQEGKVLKSEKLKDKKCSGHYPYYCDVIKINHPSSRSLEISYTTEIDAPGVLVSKDTILFQDSKVLIHPELDNPEYETSLVSGLLDLKYAKILRHGTLNDLNQKLKNDNSYSDMYIISNNEIHFDKFENSPDRCFITIGFKENIADRRIIAMANSIVSNNQLFIENILGSFNRTGTKESVILVKTPENHTSWEGFKTEGVSIVLINSKSKKDEIAHTISHEILHELFSKNYGISVTFGPAMKYNHFWFDEGFTDYYADLLNYRNGVITKKEYINALNKALRSHYELYRANQTIALEDNSFQKAMFESKDFFTNFYYSGRLIALDLENVIRARSNNKLNLDRFLQKLVKSACLKLPCNINQERFISELEKALSYNSSSIPKKYTDKYITGFTPINPPNNIVEPKITLSWKRATDVYTIGFDYIKLLHTGVISGIDKTSNAYKAGLRDNMKVLNYSSNEGCIEIEVEGLNSVTGVISFEPKGRMMIPYYK